MDEERTEDSSIIFEMDGGIGDILKVYEDRITITPEGVFGFLSKGLKGTKMIPITSITSVQVKEAGLLAGYIQFGVVGGIESRGGIFDAMSDENTFAFREKEGNELANKIVEYVQSQILKKDKPQAQLSAISLTEEIEKLAKLRDDGILSDDEFQSAKKKLIE